MTLLYVLAAGILTVILVVLGSLVLGRRFLQLRCRARLLDATAEPILAVAESGKVLFANAAFERLFGYQKSRVQGLDISQFIEEPEGDSIPLLLGRSLLTDDWQARDKREWQAKAQDGSVFPVRIRVAEMRHAGQLVHVLVLRDVHGEYVVELELRRSADRLNKAKEVLQRQNSNLVYTLSKRSEELRLAEESAERAKRSTTELVQYLSHELRNPLHAIMSFAEIGMSRDESSPPEEQLEFFETIHMCSSSLARMVNDLLDLSKLESGNQQLRLAFRDLLQITRDVIAEFDAVCRPQDVSIRLLCKHSRVLVRVDADKIAQVIRNLLSNAVKFSPQGAMIEVSLVTGNDAVMVAVRDHGPGVQEAELHRVFQKFYQAENAVGKTGAGLGLPICREILHRHSGQITARNAPSGGAILTFTLPLDPAAPGTELDDGSLDAAPVVASLPT